MALSTLAIDIGNTRIKLGFFTNNDLVEIITLTGIHEVEEALHNKVINHAVLSSVGAGADAVATLLRKKNIEVLRVSHQTRFPFQLNYNTPQTLGMDRVAAVAGAQHFFPNMNCLVIDAGTCITFDFITADGRYEGGAISPGLDMRLRAMHEFTQKLPLPNLNWPISFEGKSTEQSLLSGVCIGVVDEILGRIERYSKQYGQIQPVICGGNADLLAKHIKNNIFAQPALVLFGLNQILQFHVNKG